MVSPTSRSTGSEPDPQRPRLEQFYCGDLPSTPQPEMGTILVTGASGYVGGRLVHELLARGYTVRAMVRAASPEYQRRWPGAEIVVADALDPKSLGEAVAGVHAAYYLIHSLLLGPSRFKAADSKAAINFAKVAAAGGVNRIIYLGGLGDTHTYLSEHLHSRMKVAKYLQSGLVPVTIVRAAIIIGSGSGSYEIIQHLVKRLPIILLPRWAKSKCQPIGIRDVIKYLVGVLETPATTGQQYDIGGADVLSYEQMMRTMADLLGKRRIFMPFFYARIGFYAYMASLLTPIPAPITLCLMQGLANDVICQNDYIKQCVPFEPLTYEQAVLKAMNLEDQDSVRTRWSDAYPPAHELAMKLRDVKRPPEYTARYSLRTTKPAAALFRSICEVGGKDGWFHSNWLWRLRGGIDRVLGGVGSSRGRKRYSVLEVNDVIDFWRVEDLQPDTRLLLRAEMLLPGKAWLEFTLEPEGDQTVLSVIPHYTTQSFWGRLYWYSLVPTHHFVFANLIKQIEKRS